MEIRETDTTAPHMIYFEFNVLNNIYTIIACEIYLDISSMSLQIFVYIFCLVFEEPLHTIILYDIDIIFFIFLFGF